MSRAAWSKSREGHSHHGPQPCAWPYECNCPRPSPSWLQLLYSIQLNFMLIHFTFIPRNYSPHFPLLFSEGKKWKSHETYAWKMKNWVVVFVLNWRNIRREKRKQKKSDWNLETHWCFMRRRNGSHRAFLEEVLASKWEAEIRMVWGQC